MVGSMINVSLENKVIVVAGGLGAIGRCFVRNISSRGGIAVAADINIDTACGSETMMYGDSKCEIKNVFLDINRKESINKLISVLQQQYGKVDAVVNCAYPRNNNYGNKLEEVVYSDFCENVNLHLGGYFLVAQQFCIMFKKQGFGNIVNTSSIYGSMTPRFDIYRDTNMTMPVEYAAIKAAIEHITRYFAQYYKGTGIRINSLSPGGINAGQPINFLKEYNKHCASKGMLDVEDLTGALVFLLSDDSKYINGQNLIIDDGYSL